MRARTFVTVETYTNERKAEFLLNNAVDDADYLKARKEVRKLGLDPRFHICDLGNPIECASLAPTLF
jgi:hypothetical protein